MASADRRDGATTAKHAAVQADVLAATEALLSEGASYADLGIQRIARRAGISRTAFYFYFADKRELLMRLSADVTGLLLEQADIWWSGDGDPAEQLHTALANVAALYDEHAVLLRAVVEVSTYDEEVAQFWRGLIGQFVDASERRIEREIADGRSDCARPRATAFALTWMVERTYYEQLVQRKPITQPEIVEALSEVWLRSIYRAGGA